MLYILNKSDSEIDWNLILTILDKSPHSTSCLYLVTSYFNKNNLSNIPKQFLYNLSKKQKTFNLFSLFILHKLINDYLICGKSFGNIITEHTADIIWSTLIHNKKNNYLSIIQIPWNILFIPNNPKRYSMSFQLTRLRKLISR